MKTKTLLKPQFRKAFLGGLMSQDRLFKNFVSLNSGSQYDAKISESVGAHKKLSCGIWKTRV